MRWLVEVTSIGKADTQSFCIEGDSWQRALQSVRAHRGEPGPMSGFSIELLEDGYRAVDPMARLRYVVKRAPDDLAPTIATVSPSLMPSAPAATSSPPAPAIPADRPSKKPPLRPHGESNGSGAAVAAVKAAPAPMVPPSPPVGSPIAGLVQATLLSTREENPTDAAPLTYREYAFAVPVGTSEEEAVRVLQGQLDLVRATILFAKRGKLVNLAAFDEAFKGKPSRPPLATLAWKDWKNEPLVAFPRRKADMARAAPQKNVAAPLPAIASRPPAPIAHSQPPPPPNPPAAALAPVPVPVPVVAPVPVPAPALVPVPPPAAATGRIPSQPAFTVGGVAPTPRPPSGRFTAARGRVKGDELITQLFEAMHNLHFLQNALEGGDFCLTLACEMLPSRGALVHLYDIDRREFVIACVQGKGAAKLITRRHAETDPILSAAMRKRHSLVVGPAAAGESAKAERYAIFGGVESFIVAPVMQAGRFLGAVELINPLDGAPFTDDEGNALSYIAEQFSEFIASHGVVIDPERILAHHQANAAPPSR